MCTGKIISTEYYKNANVLHVYIDMNDECDIEYRLLRSDIEAWRGNGDNL